MHKLKTTCMTLLMAATYPAMALHTETPVGPRSLSQLEHRLEEIDAELGQLAHYSLRSGIGSVGYRSDDHPDPACTEWVQIALEPDTPVDQIMLVPAIWRDTENGFRADSFPLEFRVIAGNSQTTNTLATFGTKDRLLPRIAPLVVLCATTASWVRVEASVLSPRAFDGRYNLELSEILIFNGQTDVALRQPVQISSSGREEGGARKREFLVDGFMPYLMDAAQGEQSVAFVSELGIGEHPSLMIDLGAAHSLDRIHLHSTDLDDTIPQSTPTDFGIPRRLIVEGANRSDFSDAVLLVGYRMESVFEAGPIIMRNFPETACRYVRLTAVEPYISSEYGRVGSRMGFAEIELFANGRNVALGKPALANFKLDNPVRSFAALTDGRNLYGNILPVRDWLNELARRHSLETERPAVAAELASHYARQKVNLTRISWLAALLAAGIGFTFLIDRMIRMRQVAKIKERFAADLHDEIGANLHTIGLLSDLADGAKEGSEEHGMLHQRIREVTERTGMAVRHCTDMLDANGLYTGLVADMQRAAQRIMAKLRHDITIEGEEFLSQLKPRARVDLFLFYKECLVNISRHSGATEFSTRLTASPRQINLTIGDNGRGMPEGIPPSLKRRARLLGAKIRVECPETGGTCIALELKSRKRLRQWEKEKKDNP